MRSPRTCHASRREPRPPTTSQSSFSAGTAPRRPRALPDDDLDPAVPRVSDLVRGGDEQLALAASAGLNAFRSDPELDEASTDSAGALQRQPIVVEVGAREWWRRGRGRQQYHWWRWWRRRRDDRHLRAAREEHRDRNPEDRADHRGAGSAPAGAPVRTRNSVPRTPSMAAGVRTFIASGDCFAILPETAASVPRLSDVSNAPLWVVESNANRSMTRLLSGPIESRLLSPKVMPT